MKSRKALIAQLKRIVDELPTDQPKMVFINTLKGEYLPKVLDEKILYVVFKL